MRIKLPGQERSLANKLSRSCRFENKASGAGAIPARQASYPCRNEKSLLGRSHPRPASYAHPAGLRIKLVTIPSVMTLPLRCGMPPTNQRYSAAASPYHAATKYRSSVSAIYRTTAPSRKPPKTPSTLSTILMTGSLENKWIDENSIWKIP